QKTFASFISSPSSGQCRNDSAATHLSEGPRPERIAGPPFASSDQRPLKPLFEIELQAPAKGSRDTGHNLHLQLRAAILERRLPSGSRLPPTRDARASFGVSRNTAAEVYDRLINEGCVVARGGSGTFVADRLPAAPARVASIRTAAGRLNPFWLQPQVTS